MIFTQLVPHHFFGNNSSALIHTESAVYLSSCLFNMLILSHLVKEKPFEKIPRQCFYVPVDFDRYLPKSTAPPVILVSINDITICPGFSKKPLRVYNTYILIMYGGFYIHTNKYLLNLKGCYILDALFW